jgi:hypothetical protein
MKSKEEIRNESFFSIAAIMSQKKIIFGTVFSKIVTMSQKKIIFGTFFSGIKWKIFRGQ